MKRPRPSYRRTRSRFERLEPRVVLSSVGVAPGPATWLGSEVLGPDRNGVAAEFAPEQPVGFALWTPTSRLVSAGPRLMLGDATVAELRANASDPAYADIWGGLRGWASTFPTQAPYSDTDPYDLAAEDPWRGLAASLEDLLVVYVAEPNALQRFSDLQTLQTYFQRLGDWFDATNVAPQGSRSAATPQRDLSLSQLIGAYALAYDTIKNDANLTPAEVETVRNTLIQLTRSLANDQVNGGQAADWIGGYQHNHNWWNFWALAQAGTVLYGETAGPLDPGEAHGWLDAAIANYWHVFQDLPSGGAPAEGYLYQAYSDDPLLGMHHLVTNVVNVTEDYPANDSISALSQGVFYATLPDGYGTLSFFHDNTFRSHAGAWGQHYLASTFDDGLAQYTGNLRTANANDQTVDWQSLVHYDPAISPVDRATLPRTFDDDDMGLYYARSSWDDSTDPTVFQYHAGPAAGQTSANIAPPWGRPGGHVTPGQGHLTLYRGDDPVLPTSGYTELNSTLEYNTIVFDARDGQGGRVGFDGTQLSFDSGPVGQTGGDRRFFSGSYFEGRDHARTIRVTHDETAGVHGYLSDLGGRYRLSDRRSPDASIHPSYQRYAFYLESGAVAIVDRVRVDHPRDIYYRVPVYDGTMSQSGGVFSFTTIDGVSGQVIDTGSTTDGVLTRYHEEFRSNSYPLGESRDRNVVTLKAADATEAVFATIVGVDGAAAGVSLSAAASAVTLNGVQYDWAELARGDRRTQTFDADQGFVPGRNLDDAPYRLGQGRWSISNADDSDTAILSVVEDAGESYLAAVDWSVELQSVGSAFVAYNPIPQDLGAAAWADVDIVDVSFDLRLLDAHRVGVTQTAWEVEVGRDTGGLGQGLGAELRVLANGEVEVDTGAGVVGVGTLDTGRWTPVEATLDYQTKTLDLAIDGVIVASGVAFDGDRADYFGSLRFGLGGGGSSAHRLLAIDNVAVAAGQVAPAATGGETDWAWAGYAEPTVVRSETAFAAGALAGEVPITTARVPRRDAMLLLTASTLTSSPDPKPAAIESTTVDPFDREGSGNEQNEPIQVRDEFFAELGDASRLA